MAIKIPKFLKKKRNIWIISIIVILILGGWLIFGRGKNNSAIQTGFATNQNLKETVLTTGQVVSGTNLNLSFQGGGIVRRVLVAEGDQVSAGETLATLDQSSALASLTTAQGSLAQAQANYEKLLAGATQESIQTVQDSITSAQQDLSSAYSGSMATLNSAYTSIFNAYSVVYSIQQNDFPTADPEGIAVTGAVQDINTNMQSIKNSLSGILSTSSNLDIDLAISETITGLNNTYNDLSIIRTQADQGAYYYKISATDKSSVDAQKTTINASLTSVTALQQNIASLKIALQKANDQLSLTKAPPTQADIDAAKAQVLSAQGQVDSAQTLLNNTVLSAPDDGTITSVDVKVGEQATAMQEAMILQNISDLHAEADVSEANIALVQIGQPIDYTFDALGPDQHFAGKVLTIDSASTVIAGVVDYLVKGSLDNIPNIKPGMTANMTILVAQKNNALAVPSTAVINNNGKNYVRVVDNKKTKTFHQVQVQTGLQADGGLVEIISGLNAGQEIVTYAP